MTETQVNPLDLPGFGGTLFRPGEDSYHEARQVFNAMFDRSPALIARCTTAEDVTAVVRLARTRNLPLSVYGGGHSATGAAVCEAGICLDLRGMKGIDIDVGNATVRAEGGLTWAELDAATQAHGLAVTGGRVSTTGVGGLTLGSGSGWLERKLGLACDNLFSVEVVTADGSQVTASESENPDLFWAVRGGGGNFGVVTAFHFRLHPIGPILYGGLLLYPAPMAGQLLRYWRDFMADAPDEVGSALAFMSAPVEEFVPEPVRGQPVVGIICCYAGDVAEGEKAFAPILDFAPPGLNLVQPMPYVAIQQIIDRAGLKGRRGYWTADFYGSLPDEAVDTLVQKATPPASPLTQIIVIPGGGAIARVGDDAMAFGNREDAFNVHYLGIWLDAADDEKNIVWTKKVSGAMKPWSSGRVYLNFIADEGQGRIEAGFGPEKYTKLRELKKKWDPENLFRHNHNIPPAP
jgi:FAD/FMN-containing dehydrogenase